MLKLSMLNTTGVSCCCSASATTSSSSSSTSSNSKGVSASRSSGSSLSELAGELSLLFFRTGATRGDGNAIGVAGVSGGDGGSEPANDADLVLRVLFDCGRDVLIVFGVAVVVLAGLECIGLTFGDNIRSDSVADILLSSEYC